MNKPELSLMKEFTDETENSIQATNNSANLAANQYMNSLASIM